jgi:hypothetical protein
VLYQDGQKRVTIVGWLDGDENFNPAWAAVTLFAEHWPEEFYRLNEIARQGESIGDLFRREGFPPLQNRLLWGWLPAQQVPQWARGYFTSTRPWWKLQVGNFCAEVNGELHEYGVVCEFRPYTYPLPTRSYLGWLPVWRLCKRYHRVTPYLKRIDRPKKWDYLITWIARIAALPAVAKSLRSAQKAL